MPKLDGTLNRKERQPQRICARKNVYETPFEATVKAWEYLKIFKKWQTPYECAVCGKIHLTTVDK